MKKISINCNASVLRGIFTAGVLIVTAGSPHYAVAQLFSVTDLGTLGGESSGASQVDNLDWVVGWSETGEGERQAFVYADGSMRNLGPLPGGTDSIAIAISSNEGLIAGYSGINEYGPEFQEAKQGFIWDDGIMQSVGALYCPCSFNDRYGESEAHGVNDAGQVVGHSETVRGSHVRHAFVWQNGSMQDIGGGAGDWSISRAFGINATGQVVGDFAHDAGLLGSSAEFNRTAFLWHDGVLQNLGTLPDRPSSTALAINDAGEVAGWSGQASGEQARAFLWTGGSMQDLGTLPGDCVSRALGLNNAGQVVGWSGAEDYQSESHAFLWQDSIMVDLNEHIAMDSGWVLIQASDINERGVIVGTGVRNGQLRGFLLEPNLGDEDDTLVDALIRTLTNTVDDTLSGLGL